MADVADTAVPGGTSFRRDAPVALSAERARHDLQELGERSVAPLMATVERLSALGAFARRAGRSSGRISSAR